MARMSLAAVAVVAVMCTSCGGGGGSGWPSGQDINNSLDTVLASAAGDWTGVATPPEALRLDFKLQEGSGGQVSGTGTMRENTAAAVLPITVSGSYQRPALTLSFDGMVVDGRQVKGAVQGSYTTVGGVAATLMLTAPGYSRAIPILLQEK